MKFIEKYLPIFLSLLAFLIYANTLGHDYAWDDQLVITKNPLTTQGFSGIFEIWTSKEYIVQRPIYRPVPQTLYAILWEFFPNNSVVAHLVNVFLYIICTLLFIKLLKKLFPSLSIYIIGLIGIFFVLLPTHVEVVANVKSGDELLSTLFILLSLLFSLKENNLLKLVAIVFFVLALLSKISAITLTPMLLILFMKDENFKNYFITNLRKHSKYFIYTLGLVACMLNFYFKVEQIVSLTILAFLGAYLNLEEDKLGNFVLALLILFGICFLGNEYIAFSLIIIWIHNRLNTKGFNHNFIVFLLTSLLIFLVLDKIFWLTFIFISYFSLSIFIIHVKSKITPLIYFISFAFVLTNLVDYINTGNLNIYWSYISVIPILLSLKYKHSKRIIFFIVIFSLIFFELVNSHKYYFAENFQIKKVNITPVKENLIVNEPYHNILVYAKSSSEKLATIARIQLVYLQKLIFPTQLVHQHGTQQIDLASWKDWDVYVSIIVHLLLLFLIYFFIKRKEYWIAGGFVWYLLSISIYTNIFKLMPDTLAERFLFLPSLGFSVSFVGSIYYLAKQFLKNENKSLLTTSIVLAPLFLYYSFKTIDRNKDWKNNYTLAVNTLPFAQNNAAINAQYALELNNLMKNNVIPVSDSAKALVVSHYKKAIKIYPNFYGPNADLASFYILEAKPDSAYSYLLEANRLMPKEWLHHYYLGLIHFERNKYEEALNNFQAIIADSTLQRKPFEFPELLEAYEYSARCYHNLGNDPQAYLVLEEGIEVFNQKSSYILLGNLYRVGGKQKDAVAVFERLLVYNPNDQELINTIQYLKQGLIY